MLRLGASGFVWLALAAPALALASPVPPETRLEAKSFLAQAGAPDLAYFPARLPAHFAFESYTVSGIPQDLDLSFRNKRLAKNADQMRLHAISFDAFYLHGRKCSAGSDGIVRLAGVTLYESKTQVWRCVQSAHGHSVKEVAAGAAPLASLAMLVAYARAG